MKTLESIVAVIAIAACIVWFATCVFGLVIYIYQNLIERR